MKNKELNKSLESLGLPRIRSVSEVRRAMKRKRAAVVAKMEKCERQRVLDLFFESYSIGEICNEMDIELDIACHIIDDNLETAEYLRREAK